MSEKNALENLADAAKAKLSEGADRVRAEGHDVASKEGGVLDNVGDKLREGADRIRAEADNAKAESSFDKAKEQISDALSGKK